MGRMLLSQSQVSVALSSTIVVLFTVALFLSGYVLQQKTVRSLQDAIKPRLPQAPPSLNIQTPLADSIQTSRLFGGSLGSKGRIAYQKFMRTEDASTAVDWNRLAHIQLARTHHDVCNAIMVFGELHRLKSPARRILLFPQVWAAEKQAGKNDIGDPFTDTSRRLMRMAARRYGVELRPVQPIPRPSAQSPSDTSTSAETEKETYSLALAYGLTDFDRVLTLETPGLILDASPLDAVLAFTESSPFAMLHDTVADDGVQAADLFLLTPSSASAAALTQRISGEKEAWNDTLLSSTFAEPLLLSSSTSSSSSSLIRSIGMLHDTDRSFNATAYLSDVAYIRFSDPKLPGPEYDVPWSAKLAARPRNKDADWTWTKLYGQFAQKRMEMCGLDLEGWRPES